MTSLRRLRVPSILLLALVAALAFASTAAAETKIGEGTSPEEAEISGEADLLKANATFESTTGALTVNLTTRAALDSTPEGERPEVGFTVVLFTLNGTCSEQGFEDIANSGGEADLFPLYELETANHPVGGEPEAIWLTASSETKPDGEGPASRTVSGTTLTIAATAATAVGKTYNCALVSSSNGPKGDAMIFPLTTKPEAPAPPAPTPPAPVASFSLATIKPLKAREDKWTKVNVKVTNTGNAAIGPIAIKAKAPKGVVLQPASGSLKLPALLPGQSWTVTFRVKLTGNAKKSSTIALTTSSGAISAKGSFVVKLAG